MAQILTIPDTAQNKRFDTEYYAEGYATTFNDPYVLYEIDGIKYYEQIARDALDGADLSDVIMQYDHEGRVLARKGNGTLDIVADDRGLLVFADLSKSDAARAIHGDIKERLITKMSWCFTIAEAAYNRDTRTRTILKIKKVYDVSAVSIPANNGTEIAARSFASGRREAEKREALKRRIQAQIIKINLGGKAQ